MSTQRAREVLYESQAALRLVDNELHQLLEDDSTSMMDVGMVGYPQLVENVGAQLMEVIEQIRERRTGASPETPVHSVLLELETQLLEVAGNFPLFADTESGEAPQRSTA